MTSTQSTVVSDLDELDETYLKQLQTQLIDANTSMAMAEIFKALGDPTRLRIISLLRDHELCVHTLAALLGISESAMSHQLRTLRQLRVVRFRKEGRHMFYTLEDHHIRDLFRQGLLHSTHS